MTRRSSLRALGILGMLAWTFGCGTATPLEHLDRARDFQADGQTDSAIIELKNALQKDANLAEARLMLGELQLELGDLESALKELERALDLGLPRERVIPPLLETKADLGRTQEVLGALGNLAITPRLRAVQGQALLVGGDTAAARADFEAALAGDPATPRAYLGLAQIALAKPVPDVSAALQSLRDGTVAVPKSRRLWLALGELELNQFNAAAANAAFESARKLPGIDFMAELGLARVRVLENNIPEARKLVEDVVRRVPKHPLAQHLLGVIALQAGDLPGAETALQTALSVVPDYPPALLALAHVKAAQGQPLQAESHLRRYLALDPQNVAARQALAGLLLERGNAKGAVEVLDPIAARLTDGGGLALLGTAKLRAGDLGAATRLLTEAAASMPESGAVKTQLALSLAAAGDSAGALAQLDAIVPSSATGTQTEVLRVLLNLRRGDAESALAAAEQLVSRGEQLPLAYNLLGAVQLARQDTAAAKKAFEQALTEDPKFGPATLNLARMHQAAGDGAAARRELERSLEADSSDVAVRLALAQLVLGAGEVAKASQLLEDARAMDANALAPRIALGRLALQRGDVNLAETVSLEAEGIAPAQPATLLLRAQVAARRAQPAVVGTYLDGLEAYLAGKPADAAVFWLPVGELRRQLGRVDRARSSFEAALSGDTEVPARVALLQLEAAAKRFEPARAQLTALQNKGLPEPALKELEADLAAAEGNLEAAERGYRSASEGGSSSAVGKLALVQVQRGQPKAAVSLLEGWLKQRPQDDGVAMALASIRLTVGDKPGAKRDYETLLARQGENPVLLNNLAWLYFEAGDSRAEAMARKAAAIAPQSTDISDTLGWILVHSEAPGAVAEALTFLDKAAQGRPDNPSVQYHLAVAQEKSGRRREARQTLDRALKAGDFPERAAAEALAETLQ